MALGPGYTFGAVAEILGITETKLRYWSQVGFVGPSERKGARQVFTFQDLVSVRAATEEELSHGHVHGPGGHHH